jgi:hypothetical protein
MNRKAFSKKNKIKLTPLCIIFLVLIGCASTKKVSYNIVSDPSDVVIEVNGTTLCMQTPCKIELQCGKMWVGYAFSPDGWQYNSANYKITAMPKTSDDSLFINSNTVNACQLGEGAEGQVYFNLRRQKTSPVVEAAEAASASEARREAASAAREREHQNAQNYQNALNEMSKAYKPKPSVHCTTSPNYLGGVETNCQER